MGTDHKMNSKKDEGFMKSRYCLAQVQVQRILNLGWGKLNKSLIFRLDCEELEFLEI